jgi:hypothetical protein
MYAMQSIKPRFGLLSALLLSASVVAAAPATDEHAEHHPTQDQAATTDVVPDTPMQAMKERMRMIRQTSDPQVRMRMMEEQMATMEAMMKDMTMACPMMSDARSGAKSMDGMKPDMMRRMARMEPNMMEKRVDMMEKRVDMMQMMMQMMMRMHMGQQDGATGGSSE